MTNHEPNERDGGPLPAQDTAEDGPHYDAPVIAQEQTQEYAAPSPRPRSVVEVSRPLFWSLLAFSVLAILALGAATAVLALRDGGESDPVVATVNGETIHRSEYDRAVAQNNGEEILDGLITERLIMSEARKRNITVDDQRTAALVDEQRQRLGGEQAFQAALTQAGFTEQDLMKQLRLNEMVTRMVADQTEVTEQEIAAAYEANRDRYQGQGLEQARDQVRTMLKRQKESTAAQELIEQARGEARIEMNLPGKPS